MLHVKTVANIGVEEHEKTKTGLPDFHACQANIVFSYNIY